MACTDIHTNPPTTTSPSKYILTPATPHDIPTLAVISSHAFKADTHTRLKERVKYTDHAEEMKPVLEMWMRAPPGRCSLVNAVSEEGKVVGWVCWGFRGVDARAETTKGEVFEIEGKRSQPRSVWVKEESSQVESWRSKVKRGIEERVDASQKTEAKAAGEKRKTHGENTKDTQAMKSIKELEDRTNVSMISWQSILMPTGTKCLYIIAIAVLPSHQGRGIGRSLIQWGTKLADEKGVFCWVHSSNAGWRVFEKEGFGEVGRLEVDLDEYAEGLRNEGREDGRWGFYVFRYMKRPLRRNLSDA